MKFNKKIVTTLSTCALILGANSANAAGYSSSLYSTSGLGNAYAGSAAGAHDASDLFFNPALSVSFDKPQLVASISYLDLDIDADNIDARLDGGGNPTQVSGSEGGEVGEDPIVPALYYSTPINDRLAFGLAITSPFGLGTKYDAGSPIRNRAIESSITTININPSISYKIKDNLSIGVGVAAQYYKAVLSSFGRILGNDSFAKTKGDDWGYGYNLGLKYQHNDNLEFGIGYRSKIEHKLEGDTGVAFQNTSSRFTATGTTPESLTVGLKYQLDDKNEIVYDTTWTRWSRLNSLVLNADNSLLNNQLDFKRRDSFMYSLGLNHKLNSDWLLRSGFAYETGAATDAGREPRIPTGSRFWLTAGFNYKVTDTFSIDAAYLHQIHKAESISLADDTSTTLGNDINTLNYTSKTRVNVYSIGIKQEF